MKRSISTGIAFLLIAGVALGASLHAAAASQTPQHLKWYSATAPFGLTVSVGTPGRLSQTRIRSYAFSIVVKNHTKSSLSFLNYKGAGIVVHLYDPKGEITNWQRFLASTKPAAVTAADVITVPAGGVARVKEGVGNALSGQVQPGGYRVTVILTNYPPSAWPADAVRILQQRHSHKWTGQEVMSPAAPLTITR